MRLPSGVTVTIAVVPAVVVAALLLYARDTRVYVVRHASQKCVDINLHAEEWTILYAGWVPGRLFVARDLGDTSYPNDVLEGPRVVTRNDVRWEMRLPPHDEIGNTLRAGRIATHFGVGRDAEAWSGSSHHREHVVVFVVRDWLIVLVAASPGFVVAATMIVRGLLGRAERPCGFRVGAACDA